MSNLIDPYAEPLNQTESVAAATNLYTEYPYKKVIRTLTDPVITGQQIGLFSFVPHPKAVPSETGVYGYLKMRGNYDSEVDAKYRAHTLVKNNDSYHSIYHIRVGAFVPLLANIESKMGQDNIDEVQLSSDMTESISQKVAEKRREDEVKINEIEEQAKLLKAEAEEKEIAPIDKYIQARVKFATLKMTWLAHVKQMNEIKPAIIRTRDEILAADRDFPEFKESYFEKYKEAYSRAGLDKQINKDEMAASFLAYIKEDVVLPEDL